MIYVALLRGINVGGNAKVEMSKLKKVFESLNFTHVKTYINSGNVIFSTTNSPSRLATLIETAIKKEFKLDISIVILDLPHMQKIAKVIPDNWTNDSEQKTDVIFLWKDIDKKEILEQLTIKPEIDHVLYENGAIIWNINRQNVTKSGLLKIVGTSLYKKVTVRNVNTLRKVVALMQTI